jgi:hypothetical protein
MTPTEPPPIPAEEVHAGHHPHSTGHPFLDKALPISALLISLISLGVAVHHGGIMNEMARNSERASEASVWPFVELDSGNTRGDGSEMIYFDLANRGVGPARIESFELFYRGKPYATLGQLLADCCNDGVAKDATYKTTTGSTAPAVIAAKEKTLVFEFERKTIPQSVWTQFERLRQDGALSAKACYCSVFDKCWTTDFTSAKRTVVAQCRPPEVQFLGLNRDGRVPGVKP